MNQIKNEDNEFSLRDICKFLHESWKTIAGFTLLGIAGSALYLWVVPKQYEATALIDLLTIRSIDYNFNSKIRVEEPQRLIARMTLPTFYSDEVIAICGLSNLKEANAILVKKVKLFVPKGDGGIIELRIRDSSMETAKACTNAVFQLIRSYQFQIQAATLDVLKNKLSIEKERLNSLMKEIAALEKSDLSKNYYHILLSRDQVHSIRREILNLSLSIDINENQTTNLISPIYLRESPVFPPKALTLIVGFLLGGFFGVLFPFLQRVWYEFKSIAIGSTQSET